MKENQTNIKQSRKTNIFILVTPVTSKWLTLWTQQNLVFPQQDYYPIEEHNF